MIVFDDLRREIAETLRTRVLAVFGRAVDAVIVEPEPDLSRGDLRVLPFGVDAQRLVGGIHLPQFVRSVSVEGDGTIEFHLDRGAVAVSLIEDPPPVRPNVIEHLPAVERATVVEAVKRARTLVDRNPRMLTTAAFDRLLLEHSIPDGFWVILLAIVRLPDDPVAVSSALVPIANSVLRVLDEAQEAAASQRLLQVVAAAAFLASAGKPGGGT